MQFSIKTQLEKIIDASYRNALQERFNLLSTIVWNRVKLTIRDDSKLAWAYIKGNLGALWTPERVADELAIIYYLYNYTNYADYTLKHQFNVPMSSMHSSEFIQNFINPMKRIEFMFALFPDGRFPTEKTWPWVLEALEIESKLGSV